VSGYLRRLVAGEQLGRRASPRLILEISMNKDSWSQIAKQAGGLSAICEQVIAKGETSLDEHTLTRLITENVPRRDGETSAQAFSRLLRP
jgi:hypothetical protein